MRKYASLTRVSFFAMLSTFAGGRSKNKKRAATGIGALALMAFLGVYLSGVYCFMFAQMLAPAGLIHLVPTLIAIMSFILSLMFTCFAASGIVFGNKDSDILLSLPLSTFSIILSKIMALYLENLVFTFFVMSPACVIYLMYGGAGGIGFIIRYVIACIFLPLLATILALIIGFLLALFQSKVGRNALLGNLGYLLFFVLILIFSFKINSFASSLLQNSDKLDGYISQWLYPIALFSKGIYGSIGALLGFIAITLLPFLAISFIMSTQYKKILTVIGSTKTRKDYKLQEMKAEGVVSALYKKEFGRYFGTPIYVFNTAFGVIMVIAAAIGGIIYKDSVQAFLMQMPVQEILFPILVLVVSFMCVMTASSCVSISLEGKTLWILKEAPIESKHLFLPKALVNITLIWAIGIVAAPAAWYVLQISAVQTLALLVLCLGFGVYVGFSGLVVNLFFPKMDGTNDTLIVKQSTSVFLGIFSGFAVLGIGAGFYYLLSPVLGAENTVFLFSALLFLISFILWRFLMTKGAKMLKQI